MDKITKWKRITIYSFVCLYLGDFIFGTIDANYSADNTNSTSIVFLGFFGYALFKQYHLYKEGHEEFSKIIVTISIIVVALSLFKLSHNFIDYFSVM